jgi:hypothetical protein
VYASGYQISESHNSGLISENYLQPSSNQRDYYENNKPSQKQRDNNKNNKPSQNQDFPYVITPSGLPVNLPVGKCEQNSEFNQYNTNMFTQTIQPGMYTRNEVIEPINSNIGISSTQQFKPTTRSLNDTGVTYVEHNPLTFKEDIIEPNINVDESVNESNVYDPRHSGYGTSYRAYNDDNIGQPRFFYDDIDAVRMPNYITRNNIDFTPFGDTYGTLKEGESNGNKYNANIRDLANDAFTRNTLEQRSSLQQSMLRPANNRAWQQRMYPIKTSGCVGMNMSRR